ncbi:hypothetical protein H1S01_19055 [Heliobacterium chlorum]|uniref:Plasmid replication protein RepL domain-containing protein n=1 Tax=Heliobacterium chlorum TaxID=2698 RepID=A0ABR7T7F7_HELCL|nr:hypothetical protein [Heliobacterium chlorum]MBC9786556.1 hypothetical protein [Heliobacterium chlorum]
MINRKKPDYDAKTTQPNLSVATGFKNETGSPIDVLFQLKPGEMIRKQNKMPEGLKSKEDFTVVYSEQMKLLLADQSSPLTEAERAFLFTVLPFLTYDGHIVIEQKPGCPVRLNVERAGNLMGWQPSKTKQVLSRLEQKQVIYKDKDGITKYINLNPRYFFRGRAGKRTKAIKLFYSRFEKTG